MNYISHKSLVFAEFDDVKTKAINLENDLRTWAQVTQFRETQIFISPITSIAIEGIGRGF